MRRIPLQVSLALALCLLAVPALAHEGEGVSGGLLSGILHPLTGPDHLVAMVAVGLWGAILGPPLIWVLPITFPLMMAVGGVLGILGVPVPSVEIGIATSAIVLGVAVLAMLRPPRWLAVVMIATFAIFHGHAHGAELPDAANAVAYSIGFMVATGLLHLCGILVGHLISAMPQIGTLVVRACGGAVALVGCWFLAGHFGLA